jgi:hypothetical protein
LIIFLGVSPLIGGLLFDRLAFYEWHAGSLLRIDFSAPAPAHPDAPTIRVATPIMGATIGTLEERILIFMISVGEMALSLQIVSKKSGTLFMNRNYLFPTP